MRPFSILSLCLVLFVVAGCRHIEKSNDDTLTDIHHHNWWNYYERGVSNLQVGRIGEAVADFERSLGVRPGARFGYDHDKWRARTYGMHFVEGYFPNRELGICYFLAGRHADAARHLEISLGQTPSGRAKHYLNRVRGAQLDPAAIAPPQISIDAGREVLWTAKRELPVTGTVSSDGYVSSLRIDGEAQFVELAKKELALHLSVPLEEGENRIVIEAGNLVGQRSDESLRVFADWLQPQVLISGVAPEASGWRVTGVCIDDMQLAWAKLIVNGESRDLSRDARSTRSELDVLIEPGSEVILKAEDMAGNAVRVSLSEVAERPESQQTAWMKIPAHPQYVLNGAFGVVDAGRNVLASQAGTTEDIVRPRVEIDGPRVARVAEDEYYLSGTAGDESGVASVQVSGTDLLGGQARSSVYCTFYQRLPLEVGTNIFDVTVVDTEGNTSQRKVVVTRYIPPSENTAYRLSVTAPPFEARDDRDLSAMVHRGLVDELMKEPVRFNVRSSGDAQENSGRLSSLDMLLVGSIFHEGAGKTICVRAVDAETEEIILVEDVYSESLEEEFDYFVSGLVNKIERSFPLVRGEVVEASRRKCRLSLGAPAGIREGTKMIVFESRGGSPSLDECVPRTVDGNPVEIRVVKVRREFGDAEYRTAAAHEVVRNHDHVLSK